MCLRAGEAEPVTVEVEGTGLFLVLDDGVELVFDLEEFHRALEGECLPGEVAA